MYNWRDDIKYVAGALTSDNVASNINVEEAVNLVAQAIVDDNGADYYRNPEDAVQEEIDDFVNGGSMTIWALPLESKLYDIILDWYGWDEEAMMSSIRNAVYMEDTKSILFVTGMGYDIMSADLLGGSPDGQAARDFDEFVANRS